MTTRKLSTDESVSFSEHEKTGVATFRNAGLYGGGGNRTRVPRCFREGFYVCSRIIYAFALGPPTGWVPFEQGRNSF